MRLYQLHSKTDRNPTVIPYHLRNDGKGLVRAKVTNVDKRKGRRGGSSRQGDKIHWWTNQKLRDTQSLAARYNGRDWKFMITLRFNRVPSENGAIEKQAVASLTKLLGKIMKLSEGDNHCYFGCLECAPHVTPHYHVLLTCALTEKEKSRIMKLSGFSDVHIKVIEDQRYAMDYVTADLWFEKNGKKKVKKMTAVKKRWESVALRTCIKSRSFKRSLDETIHYVPDDFFDLFPPQQRFYKNQYGIMKYLDFYQDGGKFYILLSLFPEVFSSLFEEGVISKLLLMNSMKQASLLRSSERSI